VNINTASAEELMTLTGIGEAKAESIIRYREENGGFQRIEDLMEISGIKEGVFEKIKDDIII
jgi:competence protein ComEA